jgi:hypothetical protein
MNPLRHFLNQTNVTGAETKCQVTDTLFLHTHNQTNLLHLQNLVYINMFTRSSEICNTEKLVTF